MKFRFLLLSGLIICALGIFGQFTNASAQQIPDATNKNKELKLDFPDLPPIDQIPSEHLVEMQSVFNDCKQGKNDTDYKNCECYAMNFLAKRLETPTVNSRYIHPLLKDICYDTSAIAGQQYKACMTLHMNKEMRDWDAICSCYANYVANGAADLGTITYRNMRNLKKSAYRQCGFYGPPR
jgi:hypothetical protein